MGNVKMTWTLAVEKLPEERDYYIATTSDGEVIVADFIPHKDGTGRWWNMMDDLQEMVNVVAWMPMPTAYGKEADDEYYPIS